MPRPRAFISLLALFVVAAACGGEDAAPPSSTAPPSSVATSQTAASPRPTGPPANYNGFRQQVTACGADAPEPARSITFPAAEDQGLDETTLVTGVLETSCGNVVISLDPAMAPATVNSFVFLARQGYFDGTAMHRILPGFVIQAGDPTATGTGGPGYAVPDEFPSPEFQYTRGVLAMANAGPGTTGSQFFIVLGETALPPTFSAFGEVIGGFDVLDAIAAVPLGDRRLGAAIETSVPLETVYLERVTLQGG